MFKYITTHNITSCPQSAPFVLANSSTCSQCVSPTPVYDANTMTCISGCPTGTIFNSSAHACVGITTCQYAGQVYNSTSQMCVCPVAAPYFTGSACISCLSPSYWNDTSKVCSTCNINNRQYYNIQSNTCSVCPSYAPISTGISCVNCNATSYFNTSTSTCTQCTYDRVYNPISNKC